MVINGMARYVIQQGKQFPSHERPIHRSSYGVTAPVIHSNDPTPPPLFPPPPFFFHVSSPVVDMLA